jgi:hypothetical protein
MGRSMTLFEIEMLLAVHRCPTPEANMLEHRWNSEAGRAFQKEMLEEGWATLDGIEWKGTNRLDEFVENLRRAHVPPKREPLPPKGEWLPIERWSELRGAAGKYGNAYELPGVILLLACFKHDGDYYVATTFTKLDEPPTEAHVAHACVYIESEHDWDDQPPIMAEVGYGSDKHENIWADEESIQLRWKHVNADPPTHFMLVDIGPLEYDDE